METWVKSLHEVKGIRLLQFQKQMNSFRFLTSSGAPEITGEFIRRLTRQSDGWEPESLFCILDDRHHQQFKVCCCCLMKSRVWRILRELFQVRHSSAFRCFFASSHTLVERTSGISASLCTFLFLVFRGQHCWGSRWIHSSFWKLFYTKEQQHPKLWPRKKKSEHSQQMEQRNWSRETAGSRYEGMDQLSPNSESESD